MKKILIFVAAMLVQQHAHAFIGEAQGPAHPVDKYWAHSTMVVYGRHEMLSLEQFPQHRFSTTDKLLRITCSNALVMGGCHFEIANRRGQSVTVLPQSENKVTLTGKRVLLEVKSPVDAETIYSHMTAPIVAASDNGTLSRHIHECGSGGAAPCLDLLCTRASASPLSCRLEMNLDF